MPSTIWQGCARNMLPIIDWQKLSHIPTVIQANRWCFVTPFFVGFIVRHNFYGGWNGGQSVCSYVDCTHKSVALSTPTSSVSGHTCPRGLQTKVWVRWQGMSQFSQFLLKPVCSTILSKLIAVPPSRRGLVRPCNFRQGCMLCASTMYKTTLSLKKTCMQILYLTTKKIDVLHACGTTH